MGIDLKQAFVFVTQDEKWVQKVFIGGLLLFFPTFFFIFPGIRRMFFDPLNFYLIALFFIFTVVVYFAVAGYFFRTLHNRTIHEKEALPSWSNFNDFVSIGFKSYAGGIIFSIPFILFMLVMATFSPLSITKEIIPFALIAGAVYLIYTALYIMLALNFSRDFKIKSFLNVKKAFNAIKSDPMNYIMLVFCCVITGLVEFIVSTILVNAHIFALLLPFINFYMYIVYTDLAAQFVLGSKELECVEKECFS